ncbi:hypothetical protein ACIGW4_33420 [Streptomyces sp. NPDC053513]|uniref:hypothetical protein n=1 Tax=Streptomyces sp. NPDC053513 TaxID=3365708 RepID=UPI0037D27CEA
MISFNRFWICGFDDTGTFTRRRASVSGMPRSTSSATSARHRWCADTLAASA